MSTPIKLYNTMTKTKEEILFENRPISVYTCGPTVYSSPQIGNWRTFIFYDTLVRTLKYNDIDVQHVLNITDVGHLVNDDDDDGEDKLAKQAALKQISAWDIAEEYTDEFLKGLSALNITKPTKIPRATNHIQEQIAMVEDIEAAGYTYEASDGIYFDTTKLDDYGKLAGSKNAELNEEFARISTNDSKRSPRDFALWKFSPVDGKRDMEWESPWGIGFPGWHIECSAMAKKYLGNTLDIHAGGVDHIPIHHSNEIAQSETANSAQFARIWMHGEFMKADGKKMSKSLGNSYTLTDVTEKGFTPLDFRMLVIQGHYQTETNFTWETVAAASSSLKNIKNAATRRWQLRDNSENQADFTKLKSEVESALTDNLNTPEALKSLHIAASDVVRNGLSPTNAQSFTELLQTCDALLGLDLLPSTPDISDAQKSLIAARNSAKQDKDYAKSDEARNLLVSQGVELLDSNDQTYWQYN